MSTLKVGVLSMGDMGAGIARFLRSKDIQVATNCQGRSEDTIERTKKADVEMLPSDLELVQQCQVILSIVPPKDAVATAQRVADALSGGSAKDNVVFIDMNAVAPSTCRDIGILFEKARVPVTFVDGCIIGGPPKRKNDTEATKSEIDSFSSDSEWEIPNLPLSGPEFLSKLPDGDKLGKFLGLKIFSEDVGAASGLKMCFASMAKGFTAIATQSFATAQNMGVLDELKIQLKEVMPINLSMAERRVPGMPPKAYRWVKEMEEIGKTMEEEGGWDAPIFKGAAGVYKAVADDMVLGKEKIGKRSRGTTLDDVAVCLAEGLQRKKKKTD
ncbi:hypothetical protein VHEMI10516 [[Torrubiella] hemipterigena]|uniref:6-phosphogluconate dehydrogenase n=1 Tax=[Torrubiella] hemipterigena TaxID=1531966 RepID=A0A0A1TTE8_9HYPO|nr:hypothetical protein VHEMI10516 [[Torrubiella] hemipterigena]